MARVCRKVQERIEEKRQEAREVCQTVSRTISETVCSWLPWPLDDICDLVTRVVTELVCGLVYVLVTIVSWITRIVCEFVAAIVWVAVHLVGIAEWLGNRILTAPEFFLCLIGARPLGKKYRICPMVIADDKGVPVVPVAEIESEIETAKGIYKQCGIEVIASSVI